MATFGGANIVTDNLVLWLDAANRRSYPGSGTTWTDMSGNANNGTLTNGPTFSSTNQGSILLDGINDYVSLGTFTGFGSINRTINTWFIVTALPSGSNGRIISFPADDTSTDIPAYTLGVQSNGFLGAGFGGNPYNGYVLNISYIVNTWINIVASISSNTITVYRNGVLQGQATNTGTVSNSPIAYIGRYNNFYSQYLTGGVSTVQIYNRALSASEVQQNYNALKSRYLNQY